jgi:hypothetical protein
VPKPTQQEIAEASHHGTEEGSAVDGSETDAAIDAPQTTDADGPGLPGTDAAAKS